MRPTLIIATLQLFAIPLFGQADSCWTVLLYKTGKELRMKQDMRSFGKTGFYLYRNCMYDMETKDGTHYRARLIDIKPDTLFFTNSFNAHTASAAGMQLDTFGIHYKQLDKLKLLKDPTLKLYAKHSLDDYHFIFTRDTAHCSLKSNWEQKLRDDNTPSELAPYLTADGIHFLYERDGRTHYLYKPPRALPYRTKNDSTYNVKHVIWFTPCKVEKINGVALGGYTENISNNPHSEKDSLKINGLNIEINPFMILLLMTNPYFLGNHPDSIAYNKRSRKEAITTSINGVNVSLVSVTGEKELNGISIAGLHASVVETDGFSLSGLTNFSYKLHGVSIAGMYNRSIVTKGVQIGLVNKSRNLRGIQIGLWNVNGKRSLPFINWQFNDRKR